MQLKKARKVAVEALELTEAINLLSQIAFHQKYAFAVWKLPHDSSIHLIMDISGKEKTLKPDINNLPPGFLVSPFVNKDNSETTFIKADLHYWFRGQETSCLLYPTEPFKAEKFENALQELMEGPAAKTPKYHTTNAPVTNTKKEEFIALVTKAIQNIREEKLEKLVPAKVKGVELEDDFDFIQCFFNLCEAYPHAMVSMVATPRLGTWIGATPEVLATMDKAGIFKTVALAGTQTLPPTATTAGEMVAQASWTEKEIEEQALVSRYIINCFKKIRLRDYMEKGPKTIRAGNLMHLKTDFSVNTLETGFPELATVMLELLHPTSAVCGMPREAALAFIKENEGFDRQLFSGYLGPVNILEETNLFVNLRCMQLLQKKAAIYAGAGVIANSEPEKEWQETELKCKTLLNILTKES